MVGATEGHWGMFSDPDGVAGEAQVQLLIETYLHSDVNKCLNMLSCCRLRGVLRLASNFTYSNLKMMPNERHPEPTEVVFYQRG